MQVANFVFRNKKALDTLLGFLLKYTNLYAGVKLKPTCCTSSIFPCPEHLKSFKICFTLSIRLTKTLNYNSPQHSWLVFYYYRNFSNQFQYHDFNTRNASQLGTDFIFSTLRSSPTLTILSLFPPRANPLFWTILWCPCFHLHWILLSLTGEPTPRLPQFTEIQSSKKYFLRAWRKKIMGNTAQTACLVISFFPPFCLSNIKTWNNQIWTYSYVLTAKTKITITCQCHLRPP